MTVKPSYTLLGNGSPATVQTQARSPSRWTCPTLSTRFTEQPSCGPCASTFRPSVRWSTEVIAAKAPCSPAPEAWPCRSSPAQGEYSKGTPSVRSSSLWLSTQPSLRPVPSRRPRTLEASILAPFSSTTASVLVPPQPSAASSPRRAHRQHGQDRDHPGMPVRPILRPWWLPGVLLERYFQLQAFGRSCRVQ